jgi:hypothetical protein
VGTPVASDVVKGKLSKYRFFRNAQTRIAECGKIVKSEKLKVGNEGNEGNEELHHRVHSVHRGISRGVVSMVFLAWL